MFKLLKTLASLAFLTVISTACGEGMEPLDDGNIEGLESVEQAIFDPAEYTFRVRNRTGYKMKVEWVKYEDDSTSAADWEKMATTNVKIKNNKNYKWRVTNVVQSTMLASWWMKFKCYDDGIDVWEKVKLRNDGGVVYDHTVTVNSCDGSGGGVVSDDGDIE
jgi:ribosomal protein S30